MRPSYIDDELAVADDAGEVTVFRKLEVEQSKKLKQSKKISK